MSKIDTTVSLYPLTSELFFLVGRWVPAQAVERFLLSTLKLARCPRSLAATTAAMPVRLGPFYVANPIALFYFLLSTFHFLISNF
jgi:hypothetical protein